MGGRQEGNPVSRAGCSRALSVGATDRQRAAVDVLLRQLGLVVGEFVSWVGFVVVHGATVPRRQGCTIARCGSRRVTEAGRVLPPDVKSSNTFCPHLPSRGSARWPRRPANRSPRQPTPQLIDFAEHLVPADQISAAGYLGAVVYVSESRPGANFDFKPVTRDYTDALRAVGLHVVSNYQYGKPGWPTPSDYTRGYDGGAADARTALSLHAAAGGPDSAPIFFSVDEDISRDAWRSTAAEWFRGINSVLGVSRTGIYGHASACSWAIGDGVIGYSSTSGTGGRGRRGRGLAASGSQRPCCISPPSSPHRIPPWSSAASTSTRTTFSLATMASGTFSADQRSSPFNANGPPNPRVWWAVRSGALAYPAEQVLPV